MTEKQAKIRGLEYVGIYDRSADKVRQRALTIRALGFRVVVVTIPDDPYSRSACIGVGYGVYAEHEYLVTKNLEKYYAQLESGPAIRTALLAKHAEELKAHDEAEQELEDRIMALERELTG